MLYNAQNRTLCLPGSTMDYITFGYGAQALVLIPGVGDGLKTVKGTALPMALMYRSFAKNYRVYAFSRKNNLPAGATTRDMAEDLAGAMNEIGLQRAYVVGISQGGMIAQHLALNHPALVAKLVLAVTLAGPNDTVCRVLGRWMEMAQRGDYQSLILDTTEKSYTEAYLKKIRPFYPLLARMGKPKDFSRFLIQAASCIHHNARSSLHRISHPTLIISAGEDQVVGPGCGEELAQAIPGSKLLLYEGLGHGAYTEAKDFAKQIQGFLQPISLS